jgi:hypothetical protein
LRARISIPIPVGYGMPAFGRDAPFWYLETSRATMREYRELSQADGKPVMVMSTQAMEHRYSLDRIRSPLAVWV